MGIVITIVLVLIFAFIIMKKSSQKALKDPENFKQYVKSKGYNEQEQRDLCKRFGLNYEAVTGKQSPSSGVNKSHNQLEDCDNFFEPDEEVEIKPIPYEQRVRATFDGVEYYVAWQGTSLESTFSVNRKERVTMTPTHVLVKDNYIHVAEVKGDSVNIYRTVDISSQIQVKGRGRNSFWEWMRIINPAFPWNFHHAYPNKEHYPQDYITIWEGEVPQTTFTRTLYGGDRKREAVQPIALYKGKITGDTFLKFKDASGEAHQANIKYIDTMMATEGHKKMHFDDWINKVLLATKPIVET